MTETAFTATSRMESDVYSYGVVLLELITRKRAVDPSFTEETDIVSWVRSLWSNTAEINEIVDLSRQRELLGSTVKEQVVDVLLVALRCTEKDPNKRPKMTDVVKATVGCLSTPYTKIEI